MSHRIVGRISPNGAAIALAALLLCAAGIAAADTYDQQVADLCAAGDMPQAAAVACDWAAAEPGNIDALRRCAELAAAVGRYSRAEDALRSLLFYMPTDPDALVALGDVLLERGDYTGAREQFQAAIHDGGAPGPAYTGLARATVYSAESPGDMLSAAEVAVSVAPDYAPAHVAMGAALRQLGRLDEAMDVLREAQAIDPSLAETTFEMGRTLAMMGERQQAREAWGRYVEMAPYAPQSWLLAHRLLITDTEEISDRAFDARYSPDGSRIAYRARGEGGWGIYTIPTEGDPVETKLWATESNLQTLAWSPDGSRIAVQVLEQQDVDGKQQWTRKIFLVPADGGDAKLLADDRYLGEIAWNPANGHIGARSYIRRQGHTIVEIDPETGESEQVKGMQRGTIYYAPAWSPDGSTLLAVRRGDQRPDGTFSYDLMVGAAEDFSDARIIYTSDELPRGPTFTPDGSAILYVLTSADEGSSIWALPVDGSRDPVLVDPMAGRIAAPDISPDGRFLLTTRETMLVRATLAGIE